MRIEIYGQVELEKKLLDKNYIPTSHLISIGNPSSFRENAPDAKMPIVFNYMYKKILRLRFFDVMKKEHLGPQQNPKRIPLLKDIKRVYRFYKRTHKKADGYTIHCWRGVSRSTAVALGLLYLIYQDEKTAGQKLQEIRPEANPHPGIVGYWDNVLNKNLSSINEEVRKNSSDGFGINLTELNQKIREEYLERIRKWFLEEIEEGDALLEELEEV